MPPPSLLDSRNPEREYDDPNPPQEACYCLNRVFTIRLHKQIHTETHAVDKSVAQQAPGGLFVPPILALPPLPTPRPWLSLSGTQGMCPAT